MNGEMGSLTQWLRCRPSLLRGSGSGSPWEAPAPSQCREARRPRWQSFRLRSERNPRPRPTSAQRRRLGGPEAAEGGAKGSEGAERASGLLGCRSRNRPSIEMPRFSMGKQVVRRLLERRSTMKTKVPTRVAQQKPPCRMNISVVNLQAPPCRIRWSRPTAGATTGPRWKSGWPVRALTTQFRALIWIWPLARRLRSFKKMLVRHSLGRSRPRRLRRSRQGKGRRRIQENVGHSATFRHSPALASAKTAAGRARLCTSDGLLWLMLQIGCVAKSMGR
mmetsp:Transcript_116754/g.330286  ORF Transcript_116754/g.330286 Transcript_116754/m.330286 type:complete len:277 (+) Transcript_116754:166-996(+)